MSDLLLNILICIFLLGILFLLFARLVTSFYSRGKIYNVENVPIRRAALVLGAGLLRDGSPTAILKDRVEIAVNLYKHKKVEMLLMSGDGQRDDHNEPAAMREYALSFDVPAGAIVLDPYGKRTFDSCFRARQVYELKDVIVVTQGFHLPRALFIGNHLGLQVVGVRSDLQYYRIGSRLVWNFREILATATAIFDIYFRHPVPATGDSQPIFPRKRG